MKTRRTGNLFRGSFKLLLSIIIGCSLSLPVYAEYYLVTGGAPDMIWIKGHRCIHHRAKKHRVRHYCHYRRSCRSPKIDVYLLWRQVGCGCCGSCNTGIYGGESYNVYMAQPQVDNYTYSWGYANESYNPDIATADDTAWYDANLQSDDYTYSY